MRYPNTTVALSRNVALMLLMTWCQSIMADVSEREILHRASVIVAGNNYDIQNALFLHETAEEMHIL